MINIEELKELRPGDLIFVVSRNWDNINQRVGKPNGVSEFIFLAYINNYIIASKVDFFDINEEMVYGANDTAKLGSTRFFVFSIQDCYMQGVEAREQMKRELDTVYSK